MYSNPSVAYAFGFIYMPYYTLKDFPVAIITLCHNIQETHF